MRRNYVLRISLKPLIPLIMIFGLYVQFHGDFGPGGGFQAGVIFASGIILYALIFGLRRATQVFTPRRLAWRCGIRRSATTVRFVMVNWRSSQPT